MAAPGILIVEDDAALARLCERSLAALGAEVAVAASATEAESLLNRRGFDLVVSDVQLPGTTDGLALAAEIKRLSPTTDVIVMTGAPDLEKALSALRSGAYDFLIKPFPPDLLAAAASRCLDKRRLSSELARESVLRRELEAAYTELQKVERLKDAFLGRVNHELRTPIAVAMLSLEGIARERLDERGRQCCDILASKLALLRELVESLLLFSSLQRQEHALNRAEVDLKELVARIVSDHAPLWKERGLSVEVSAQGDVSLRADPELLATAVKHLFLNAVYFNKKGGAISLRVAGEGGSSLIEVADTGPGIPQAELPRLFDSFYQVAEHMTRKVGGLGLGLALVRRIVEAHGGTVSVESVEGLGTTFRAVLPKS